MLEDFHLKICTCREVKFARLKAANFALEQQQICTWKAANFALEQQQILHFKVQPSNGKKIAFKTRVFFLHSECKVLRTTVVFLQFYCTQRYSQWHWRSENVYLQANSSHSILLLCCYNSAIFTGCMLYCYNVHIGSRQLNLAWGKCVKLVCHC